MSRIGKKPVTLGKAKASINGQKIVIEGAKGKLELNVHPLISVKADGGDLVVTRPNDERESKALHGLTRALLANMVEGVTNGYKKTLEIQGVGYKADLKGKTLVLTVGFANPVNVAVPPNVSVAVDGGLKIHVTGVDKQAVGHFAAEVRKVRKPEPYKGKGIRYEGEQVKIKPGKAFAGAGAK
ncbi:MAG TPA: 50S ribosomal protein L6 [Humisphaera sp.]